MSAEAKVEMLTDVMNRVKNQLLKILIKPEQAPTIDKAIVKLLDFYKTNLV